jgi:hypothetical protein
LLKHLCGLPDPRVRNRSTEFTREGSEVDELAARCLGLGGLEPSEEYLYELSESERFQGLRPLDGAASSVPCARTKVNRLGSPLDPSTQEFDLEAIDLQY